MNIKLLSVHRAPARSLTRADDKQEKAGRSFPRPNAQPDYDEDSRVSTEQNDSYTGEYVLQEGSSLLSLNFLKQWHLFDREKKQETDHVKSFDFVIFLFVKNL